MIILSQTFAHNDQDFEIFVKYDEVSNQVLEVKSIMLHTHGTWYPVGSIMDKFFKEAIWKLIKGTNWETIYNEFVNPKPKKAESLIDTLHPVMQESLSPFMVTGGDLKTVHY